MELRIQEWVAPWKLCFNQYQFNLVKKMKENYFSFVSLERKMKQGLNSFNSTIWWSLWNQPYFNADCASAPICFVTVFSSLLAPLWKIQNNKQFDVVWLVSISQFFPCAHEHHIKFQVFWDYIIVFSLNFKVKWSA